jgi:hypothetical protein
MKLYIICLFALILAILMAGHGPASSEKRSFGNSDLEKFNGNGGNGLIIPDTIPPKNARLEKPAKKASNEKSKQYWCSKGSSKRNKVDRAKLKVEDAERKLADMGDHPGKNKTRLKAEKKLRSAKKELYRAEQELEDLEQSAHRQNVPTGWLRCQFTY